MDHIYDKYKTDRSHLNPLLASVPVLLPTRLTISLLLKLKYNLKLFPRAPLEFDILDQISGLHQVECLPNFIIPGYCTLSLCKAATPDGTAGCTPEIRKIKIPEKLLH